MGIIIGLDVGIGSIGWAILSVHGTQTFIENFGVRIFDSGENVKARHSECQDRRTFRGVRRLERRRSHRKMLLTGHLQNIGLLPESFADELRACADEDIYNLKVRGLDEKLSPVELYRCLIHTCNHRGYRDFYENDQGNEDEKSDDGVNKTAARDFDSDFASSGSRTVSEYLIKSHGNGAFVQFRNKQESGNEYRLIHRSLMEDEVRLILRRQKDFYSVLTEQNIDTAVKLIFNQRDFEDGPGNPEDPFRRYKGFLAARGTCPYYHDEKRGFRSTVIGDIFAMTNTLSQYRFIDNATGEFRLPSSVAEELIRYALEHAGLSMTELKKILKPHGLVLKKSENSDDKALGKAFKFLRSAKNCVESAGLNWLDFISEEQFDIESPSRLHRAATVLSTYQTPRRRRNELKKLDFLTDPLRKSFSEQKLTGTARTSDRYMCDAIDAFMKGEIYGDFQARSAARDEVPAASAKCDKLLPKHIDDEEVRDNPVVFKAINETRKIVNAIIALYGTPDEIIIETADELGRSFEERAKIQSEQKRRESDTDAVKKAIRSLMDWKEDAEVTSLQVDKYRLYHQQEGKSLYSGEALGDLSEVISDPLKKYEVDHIVPFSLILDNTLSNKALVFSGENQKKGQRTPLMFLTGEERSDYTERVNYLYNRDNNGSRKKNNSPSFPPVTKKKLEYLLLETVYSPEAKEMLEAWKSRNINDTRYITKYLAGLFSRYLNFTDNSRKNVFAVKGAVTSRFRRYWLGETDWGDEEKKRDSYLNHAVDAIVIANLSKPYIEIGSDAVKLRQIYNRNHRDISAPAYKDYFESCVRKMRQYYGFDEKYTALLLSKPERIPSRAPKLAEEVKVRTVDDNEEAFKKGIKEVYGNCSQFVFPPQMPITSHKQERKFKGTIADSNPLRLVESEGEMHKVSRKAVRELTLKDLDRIRTDDSQLLSTLHRILDGKGNKYTVQSYLTEHSLTRFVTDGGQVVNKVSLEDTSDYRAYYRKEIGSGNYSNIGGLKYYCVEVYRDKEGYTRIRGVRFVDVVRKNKKLYIRAETIPEDYAEHIMYLFPGDYIEIYNSADKTFKNKGVYRSVYDINASRLCYYTSNIAGISNFTLNKRDIIRKYDLSILGMKGGEIKCSAPLSLIGANESESRTIG